MKASEAAKLLADRVNQLHYIESIMEKVYKCGLRDATQPPPTVSAEEIIDYIEKDAEILIPIEELTNKGGNRITQKEYGHILLKYLVLELRHKYRNLPVKI